MERARAEGTAVRTVVNELVNQGLRCLLEGGGEGVTEGDTPQDFDTGVVVGKSPLGEGEEEQEQAPCHQTHRGQTPHRPWGGDQGGHCSPSAAC